MRVGVQVMSAFLVDVSVADLVTTVLWLSVCLLMMDRVSVRNT